MLIPLLFILVGIVLLYFGAEGLVRGSASIAGRLGLSPLVIGLTVVAFGTSMPEMVVSIGAALSGTPAIAVGNVVGSNIGNIALILGLCALLQPLAVRAQIVRLDIPVMIVASLVLVPLLRDDELARWEGLLLVAVLVGYTAFNVRRARRESRQIQAEFEEGLPAAPRSILLDLVFILGGLVVLVVGARLLVSGAVTIARGLGIGDAIIGLTIVAVGTSLPELATSVLAAYRKEGDIAIGNVVGSNIFNILGILGVTAIVRPLHGTGLRPLDLTVMIALAVALLPLVRSGLYLHRWEGGVLLAGYVAYVTQLIL